MATQAVTLLLRATDTEPNLYQFTKSSYGANNAITFTIKDASGTVKNLTGFTLKMILYDFQRVAVWDRDLVIVVAANGTAKYTPVEGDLTVKNLYFLRVELKDSTNKEYTEETLFEVV